MCYNFINNRIEDPEELLLDLDGRVVMDPIRAFKTCEKAGIKLDKIVSTRHEWVDPDYYHHLRSLYLDDDDDDDLENIHPGLTTYRSDRWVDWDHNRDGVIEVTVDHWEGDGDSEDSETDTFFVTIQDEQDDTPEKIINVIPEEEYDIDNLVNVMRYCHPVTGEEHVHDYDYDNYGRTLKHVHKTEYHRHEASWVYDGDGVCKSFTGFTDHGCTITPRYEKWRWEYNSLGNPVAYRSEEWDSDATLLLTTEYSWDYEYE